MQGPLNVKCIFFIKIKVRVWCDWVLVCSSQNHRPTIHPATQVSGTINEINISVFAGRAVKRHSRPVPMA